MIENPGPLAKIDGQPASNFYGGKYNIEVNDDIADAIGIADSYFIAQTAANQCAW